MNTVDIILNEFKNYTKQKKTILTLLMPESVFPDAPGSFLGGG